MNNFTKRIFAISIWFLLCICLLSKIYYVCFYGIENTEYILLFSFMELIIITFYFLIKLKQRIVFHFLFLFTFIFYFYNHFYPIFHFLIIDISIFDEFTDYHIYNALVLSTITFSLLVQLSFITSKLSYFRKQTEIIKNRSQYIFQNIQGFSKRKKYFLLVYVLFSLLAFYYSFRYFTLPPEIKNNRESVLKILWSGPGVYIKAILIGVSAYIFIYLQNVLKSNNIVRISKGILLSVPVVLFWTAHIGAGNRRELISLLIFILIFYVLTKSVSLKKIIITAIILFTIMSMISMNRGGSNQNEKSLYLNSFGEFIFPYNTLIESMRKDKAFEEYRLGNTYFYPFYAFIPRSVWKNKPFPIATQFSRDMDKGFGLGFSPLTEAYMNWGKIAVLILPFLFLFLYIFFFKLDRKFPCLYIFLLMNIQNLNRGELGTVLLELFLMYLPFYFLYYFSKYQIKYQ